jgi:threonine dehydrogenase-like Zn-dependent dehydrogenase
MSTLPDTMRAAVYHQQGDLSLEDRDVPDLGPRDVLLEVSHCGICGSDIHFVLEGWWETP